MSDGSTDDYIGYLTDQRNVPDDSCKLLIELGRANIILRISDKHRKPTSNGPTDVSDGSTDSIGFLTDQKVFTKLNRPDSWKDLSLNLN